MFIYFNIVAVTKSRLFQGKDSRLIKKTSCSVVHSHWSRLNEAQLSLVESFIVLRRQCLLCHKEPAPRIQSPLLGALERKKPPTRGFLLAPRWFFMA